MLEINEKILFWYEAKLQSDHFSYDCNSYIEIESSAPLMKIIDRLNEEQSQTTKSSGKIRKLSSSAIFQRPAQECVFVVALLTLVRFQATDKLATVIKKWKLYHVAVALNTWRELAQQHKLKQECAEAIDATGPSISASASRSVSANTSACTSLKSSVDALMMSEAEEDTTDGKGKEKDSEISEAESLKILSPIHTPDSSLNLSSELLSAEERTKAFKKTFISRFVVNLIHLLFP